MITPESVNAWRIIPRICLALYGYICWDVWSWFKLLENPSTQQVAFATTIWGAAAIWFNFYVNSGKND